MSNQDKNKSSDDVRDKLRQAAEQRRAEREAEARRQELRDKVESRKAEREAETRRQELRDQVAARRTEREQPPASAPAARQTPPARPASAPAARQTPPARPAAPPARPAAPPSSRPAGVPGGTPASSPAQAAARSRAMPPPPPRQTVAAPVIAAELSPEAKREIDRIHRRFNSLQGDAQLGSVYSAIGQIDTAFTQLPLDIDRLRGRGYAHSRQAEAQVDAFRRQWDSLRPRVESSLTEHVNRLSADLQQASQRVRLVSTGTPAVISGATTAVDNLESKVRAADQALRGLYNNLNSELQNLTRELDRIKKMLDLLDESPDIHLRTAEGPIAFAEAQWQRDGNDGPEGILYLTDQRILFERKEEVVTRRVLGIFKADSEKHQQLMLDIAISDIENIKPRQESSGFLGMGRSEFLELTLSANAPVSRARILLKEGNAADWISKVKRTQTGDINRDRHEAYVEEVEAADSVLFPTQCPSCFATVPPAPRGVRTVSCEFCGATINPI